MARQIKAHFLDNSSPEFSSKLNQLLGKELFLTYGEQLIENLDFEILISGTPTEKDLMTSSKLTKLVIPWAGLPQRTGQLLKGFPQIEIYNLHYNAPIVAENAITLMLSTLKRLIVIDRTFRTNDWRNRYQPPNPSLLSGKKIMLLGYGAIAKEIEKRLSGWGVEFIKIKRTAETDRNNFTIDSLDELLPETNILFITLPHTPLTTNILDRKRLALLPQGCAIINIARGAVIDETALYNELKSGRLMAGLDVWYNYPKEVKDQKNCPPSKFPFGELENVVMTPHMGGHSDRSDELLIKDLANLLNKLACGETTANRVDIERGY